MEDLKTYIPGFGFIITSWDGSEQRIIPDSELFGDSEENVEASNE